MSKRPLFIVAYDVASPIRRRQLHRVVKEYATGGQKSVFECFLAPVERQTLIVQARGLINKREDRFALFRVEQRTAPLLLGRATRPVNPDFFYVG